jgi:hypothetical protein
MPDRLPVGQTWHHQPDATAYRFEPQSLPNAVSVCHPNEMVACPRLALAAAMGEISALLE